MRSRRSVIESDRAVSDIVGYVLVFSLIVATVGVVTVVGFGTLDDRQTAERTNNVERAFDVFSVNVENVVRDGAPSRATEMRLAGGTIRHGDPVAITIEAESGENTTVVPRPLVYEDGTTEIVYVAGAVIRSDGGHSVMIREPPFRTDSSTASFPLIETFRTGGPLAVSSTGTMRITSTARSVNTTAPTSFDDPGQYTITVDSARSDAWARYFEAQPSMEIDEHHPETVTAQFDTDRVVAPRFPIRLRFSE